MKKPNAIIKKLALTTETLATLTPETLNGIVGGIINIATCLYNSCNTQKTKTKA